MKVFAHNWNKYRTRGTVDNVVGEVLACLHYVLPLGVSCSVQHEQDEDVPEGVVLAVIKTHAPPASGLLRLPRGLYYGLGGFALGTACGMLLEALRQSAVIP